jgi:hypothetical protein
LEAGCTSKLLSGMDVGCIDIGSTRGDCFGEGTGEIVGGTDTAGTGSCGFSVDCCSDSGPTGVDAS